MSLYVRANTGTPTGFRPWNYKLGAYYKANFVVPSPDEVGPRLSGSFNRPGGMTSTNWGNKDNPGAPRPVYRVPELLPGHYQRGLGLVTPPAVNGSGIRRVDPPVRIVNNYYSGQPATLTVPAAAPPATTAVVASNGQPIANPTPATAAPASSSSSLSNMYANAVAWLESSTLITGMPNYVPAGGAAIAAYLLLSGRKGRR